MPMLHVSADFDMHYVVDDFTDPWRTPEAVLMLHGNHESHLAWYGWVPQLARQYRVVRPDMRGFGASTPMPRDFPWTLAVLIDDYVRLLDELGIARCHIVSAKIGGIIGRAFAARRPDRVHSLTVVGSPPPVRTDVREGEIENRIKEMETTGIEPWARRSMSGRLGSGFPAAGAAWWTDYLCRTPVSTEIGFVCTINLSDIRADMQKIKCPMLVITTEGSGLASVAETRAWQEQVPNSELIVLPGDSFHVAATDAERCAQATLAFLARQAR